MNMETWPHTEKEPINLNLLDDLRQCGAVFLKFKVVIHNLFQLEVTEVLLC